MIADLLEDDDLRVGIEAELIRYQLRLRWLTDGTDRLEWEDLWAILHTSGEKFPFFSALDPERAAWDSNTYMLANVVDVLLAGNWQRGGGEGAKPKPLTRPKPKQDMEINPADDVSGVYKGASMTMDEVNQMLGVLGGSDDIRA